MDRKRAYEIINALAEGVNPLTGEILPDDHLCNTGDVLRALQFAANSLNKKKQNPPENAGKPWSEEDDDKLCKMFDAGISNREIKQYFKRTETGIASRLVRLGKIQERDEFRNRK